MYLVIDMTNNDYENITFAYSAISYGADFDICLHEENKIFDQIFLPTFYSILFIAGMLGNGLVMLVMLTNRQKMQSTDVFIVHLALADMLLVSTLPFWAAQATFGWVFGEGLCKIVASVFKINFYAGTFLLVCISIDRYLSIVYAVQVYNKHKKNHVHWSCLTVWCLCIIMCIPDAIYYSVSFESRINMTTCEPFYPENHSKSWKVATTFLFQILVFLLPLIGMLFCYTHIIIRLLRSQKFKKERAIRLIIAVVVAFFLCWTPYNIVAFLDMFTLLDIINDCTTTNNLDFALSITSCICYLHCCLNPILYAFIGAKFKNNMFNLISKTRLCPQIVAKHLIRRQTSTKSSTWSSSGDTTMSGIY
ncbi:C-X-C chemokine receptor type 3-like isoform X1 [Bufo gargarizans]|uniref:C-X-C chemokine receptor type 3-like isoform X1 n=2 Tax=Bufo gargarizans TaxID=30331 RepID=UPI001CF5D04B|nr:C-X-C chemokine receptor type 3-like isoform X1 [Bufo gargarizans]